YNAVTTLAKVLDRIPEGFRKRVAEVFVFDDSSKDDTYLLGMGYKAVRGFENLNIFRNPKNLGYGGNQKRGYRYAIEQGHDIVALLHGDGQYAPEHLEELVAPIEQGEADAVFGSRMMVRGAARKGGMPLYKYVGNKVLTGIENRLLGMNLTEFHSGYRVYSTRALAAIPFEENTDDFHFDTEIIIQLHQHGLRIVEKPIPTFYGDEVCYVNGPKYAFNILRAVVRYRLHRSGLRDYPNFRPGPGR
ncbi:glycosyltransferase family 2 protein, partial [candidate division WOR-3 bacterium]|nr:glycosyltransferase family 2 protein [candidate division WOR-3 bacterium]